ncbi:MAG: glutamate racemase [Bacteroidetes bacterium]|nr:glutamate racemase [Bacteroidota bacterium]
MMESQAPIGIFDSGLGGLTVLQSIQERLPHESLLYFGDTGHLPYGDKSPQQVRGYVRSITRYLLGQGVKAIVVACNTASAAALDVVMEEAGPVPVVEVISPAAQAAIAATRNGIVGIIGTKTTVSSGMYTQRLSALRADVQVIARPTPLLVPLIEEGWQHTQVLQDVVATYLAPDVFPAIDTLILGCTHYPIISEQVARHLAARFPQPVQVITSGPPTADQLALLLARHQLQASAGSQARYCYQVSDLTPTFQMLAHTFLQSPIALEQVTLS